MLTWVLGFCWFWSAKSLRSTSSAAGELRLLIRKLSVTGGKLAAGAPASDAPQAASATAPAPAASPEPRTRRRAISGWALWCAVRYGCIGLLPARRPGRAAGAAWDPAYARQEGSSSLRPHQPP